MNWNSNVIDLGKDNTCLAVSYSFSWPKPNLLPTVKEPLTPHLRPFLTLSSLSLFYFSFFFVPLPSLSPSLAVTLSHFAENGKNEGRILQAYYHHTIYWNLHTICFEEVYKKTLWVFLMIFLKRENFKSSKGERRKSSYLRDLLYLKVFQVFYTLKPRFTTSPFLLLLLYINL